MGTAQHQGRVSASLTATRNGLSEPFAPFTRVGIARRSTFPSGPTRITSDVSRLARCRADFYNSENDAVAADLLAAYPRIVTPLQPEDER